MSETDESCSHEWVSNSGHGGEPVYRSMLVARGLVMHVRCSKCNARTWLTKNQWDAIKESPEEAEAKL